MTGRRERITVYIADDHPVYLAGLASAIKQRAELELVGTAEHGRLALAEISQLKPDVTVLDLSMPDLGGVEVINALRRDGVPTRVLLLSAEVRSESVYEAIATGAQGYISKLTGERTICESISRVARGETVLPDEIGAGLVDEIQRRGMRERPVLSERERGILRLLADGSAVPEIAAELHLSPATVRTHLQKTYEKLGVSTQAAAVAAAMRHKLLE